MLNLSEWVYVSDERRLPVQAASRSGCFYIGRARGRFKRSAGVPTLVRAHAANNGTHQITTDPMAHTVAGSNLRQDV